MKNIIAFLLIILLLPAFALEPSSKALELFEAGMYAGNDNDTLLYRLLSPQETEENTKYPLVLFLHGAGERGNDNERQLIWGADHFITEKNLEQYPCYVLAPQCYSSERWVDVSWELPYHFMPEKASRSMRQVIGLLQELQEDLPVDTDRIYVTGLSMGGYGTWDIISRKPELFAAAAPICGGGDVQQAENLTGIPIWVFHSVDDAVVPVERSRKMIIAIRKAGGKKVRYTEYTNAGHGSWKPAYKDQEFMDWLFAQEK
ncbi:MAG: prolyl oligopeptidase family serine peptidase [Candidatus Marinimicrobia bacterium]|nr:prolyl oligopeptidase family serine peptidase [Candidatus Neomarinimicrobiota bacterium]